jgi:hypothetical protein
LTPYLSPYSSSTQTHQPTAHTQTHTNTNTHTHTNTNTHTHTHTHTPTCRERTARVKAFRARIFTCGSVGVRLHPYAAHAVHVGGATADNDTRRRVYSCALQVYKCAPTVGGACGAPRASVRRRMRTRAHRSCRRVASSQPRQYRTCKPVRASSAAIRRRDGKKGRRGGTLTSLTRFMRRTNLWLGRIDVSRFDQSVACAKYLHTHHTTHSTHSTHSTRAREAGSVRRRPGPSSYA